MKKIIVIAVIVVTASCGLFYYCSGNKEKSHLETAVASLNDMESAVTATGTVEPVKTVDVGTQVSGIISKIYVDYNSVVKKGEVLAELDRVTLESDLASQTATMQSAKVEYEYQLRNYERSKELHDKLLISDSEFERDYYTYEKALRAYEKSKSDLIRSKTNLGYATITSPIDGIVLSRSVDEGQTVASSFNTPTLFIIANDLTKMQVTADVDEADIGQVKVGQKVLFDVDAFPNDVFHGVVTQVRLEATNKSNVITYQVIIDAPNPNLTLKPGLTANVSIKTLELYNVLTVPSRAFKYKAEKNAKQKSLWVLRNGIPERADVLTGFDDRVNTQILSGINKGDTVVVAEVNPSELKNKANKVETSPFMQGPKR